MLDSRSCDYYFINGHITNSSVHQGVSFIIMNRFIKRFAQWSFEAAHKNRILIRDAFLSDKQLIWNIGQ